MTCLLIGLGCVVAALAAAILTCAFRLAGQYDRHIEQMRAYREVRDE